MRLSKKKIEELLNSNINNKNYFDSFCDFWLPIYKHQVNECKLENNKEALSEIMLNLIKNIHLTDDEKRYIAKRIGIYYLVEEKERNDMKRFFADDSRYAEALRSCKKVCKCGHRVFIVKKYGYGICDYCGTKLYGDKKLEFREKLKQKMKEGM